MASVTHYPYCGLLQDFSCEVNCQDLVAGQHYDVTICFPDLAREPVKVRWVMQVGDANFDENDDDWWWTDEEYPEAVGVYVSGYTNQPGFFRKFYLPVQLDPKERHRISVEFPTADYLDDDYSDTPIGVSIDGFTLIPTGPGLGMKGRGKGSVKLGPGLIPRKTEGLVIIGTNGNVEIADVNTGNRVHFSCMVNFCVVCSHLVATKLDGSQLFCIPLAELPADITAESLQHKVAAECQVDPDAVALLQGAQQLAPGDLIRDLTMITARVKSFQDRVRTGSQFCLLRPSRSRSPRPHGAKGKGKAMHAVPPPPGL